MDKLQHRVIMLTGWRRLLLAMGAGAVTSLSLAPFHLVVVCFVTFPLLVWLLDGAIGLKGHGRRRNMKPAFWIGWAFGFGYFLAGLWWIANALLVEAGDFIWFLPIAMVALPAILALFWAVATALARFFWSEGFARIAMLAGMLGIAEFLRGYIATGFPWNAIGYAAMPMPVMMQSASVVGVDGMNALAVFVFGLPAAMTHHRGRTIAAAILMVVAFAAHSGFGFWRLASVEAQIEPDEPRLVRLVQPSIAQSEKWDADERVRIFATLLDLTNAPASDGAVPDIIVWPETAVPFLLTETPDAVAAIADRLEEGQTLVVGAVRRENEEAEEPAYYNSIFVIDDKGVISDAADKAHLVPFGEYLPLKSLLSNIGLKAVAAADRGYVPAQSRKTLDLGSGLTALPSVCYEIIFARYSSGSLADESQVIVNVTNDAWYGNTPGPYQHLHQARIRAVESGLPLIRAANNGISGMFDGFGAGVVSPIGYDVRGAVQGNLPPALPVTLYRRHGEYISWLIFVAFLCIGLTGAARRMQGA